MQLPESMRAGKTQLEELCSASVDASSVRVNAQKMAQQADLINRALADLKREHLSQVNSVMAEIPRQFAAAQEMLRVI